MPAKGTPSQSLPARGVWIEILRTYTLRHADSGHSPQGECGLKFEEKTLKDKNVQVTPRKGSVD